MSAEDTFTSIQWDRGEESQHPANERAPPATISEGENDDNDTSLPVNDVQDANSDADINVNNVDDGEADEIEDGNPLGVGDLEDTEDNNEDEYADDADPSNSLLMTKGPSNDSDRASDDKGDADVNSRDHSDNNHPNQDASIKSLHSNNLESAAGDKGNIDLLGSPAAATSGGYESELGSTDEPNLFYSHTVDSSVTSPIRDLDSASKPFISYQITTTTNHPSVIKLSSIKPTEPNSAMTIKVRRRYGDFRFLHDCLSNDYPQILVPPLPSKLNFKYLTGDTFSTAFVHKRLHSLDRFVKYITNHSILSQLSIFHLFVSDSPDWSTFTKNLKISKNNTSSIQEENIESSGFTSSVVNKVVNEDLLTETVMNFLTPAKHKRETNKDILEISDKLKKLYENLLKLDKIFTKLNKKNHDLSQDYEQFANQISKLSIIQSKGQETGLGTNSDEVNGDATESSKDQQQFTDNFKVFAQSLSYFSNNWASLHKYIDESFLVSLKDCSKYIISLTNLIELQHNKKIDLQVLQDYLNKSRGELASFGGRHATSNAPPPSGVLNGNKPSGIVNNTTQLIKDTISTSATPHIASSNTDGKLEKLQHKIEQLENEIKLQTDLVQSLTNKIINEEYPNWDKFNKNELKQNMVGLCNEEIKFYKGLVDNWSDVEVKLMSRLEELK